MTRVCLSESIPIRNSCIRFSVRLSAIIRHEFSGSCPPSAATVECGNRNDPPKCKSWDDESSQAHDSSLSEQRFAQRYLTNDPDGNYRRSETTRLSAALVPLCPVAYTFSWLHP